MSWASNDRWKHSSWRIVSGKAGLAHSGTIINDQRSNVVVTHFGKILLYNKYKLPHTFTDVTVMLSFFE